MDYIFYFYLYSLMWPKATTFEILQQQRIYCTGRVARLAIYVAKLNLEVTERLFAGGGPT